MYWMTSKRTELEKVKTEQPLTNTKCSSDAEQSWFLSKPLHRCEFLRNSVQCPTTCWPKQFSVSKTCSSLSLWTKCFSYQKYFLTPPSFLFIFSFAGTIFKATSSFCKTRINKLGSTVLQSSLSSPSDGDISTSTKGHERLQKHVSYLTNHISSKNILVGNLCSSIWQFCIDNFFGRTICIFYNKWSKMRIFKINDREQS